MRRVWVVVAALVLPLPALAEHRFAIVPSVDVTEVQDDNLNFSVDNPLSDRIQRITPSLALRFDSPRLTARGSYGLDSERFATHSALDDVRARERAVLALQYEAAPRLSLSLDGAYMNTNTPADLNLETGLAASRIRAQRTSIVPAARFRISSRTTLEASASSMTTNVEDGTGMRSQSETAGLVRQATPRDVVRLEYERSHLLFRGLSTQTIDSEAVLAGWSRDLSARSHWVLRAGPRITDRHASADVSGSLVRDGKYSSLSVSLARTQTTVIGYAGAVDTQVIETKLSFGPSRRLFAYAAPAFIRSTHAQLEGTVYRLAVGARYVLTPAIGVDVSYDIDRQNGAIDPLRSNADFSHRTLSVGLTTRWNRDESFARGGAK